MPKVPTYEEPAVQLRGLPTTYQSANIPQGAFGEFEARALQQAGKTIQETGQIIQRRQREKDANLVMETVAQAEDELRPFLYDKTRGEKFQFGKNAIGSTDRTKKYLDDIEKKYEKQLKSPRQRQAFKSVFAKTKEGTLNRIADHEGRQFRVYQDENTAAIIKGAERDVMEEPTNPQVIQDALLRARTVIAANHHGQGVLSIEEKIKDAESRIHTSAIMSMSDDNAEAAREYYKANKSSIDPVTRSKIEKTLDTAALKQTAQEVSDIISDQGGSIDDQLKKVRDISKNKTYKGIDSSDLRDEVERRIKTKYAFEEKVRQDREREIQNQTWNKIDAVIDSGGDVNAALKIADDIDDFETRHRMENYIEKRLKDGTVRTDIEAYNDLNRMITDDPEKFLGVNMAQYKDSLSNSDLKKFSDIQKKMRAGDDSLSGQVRTIKQRADGALTAIGLDTTPKPGTPEARRVNQFRKKLDDEIAGITAPPKTKQWYDEVDAAIARLTLQGELKGSGIFDDDDVRLYEVIGTPDATRFYVDDKIEDLDAETRTTFEDQLKTMKIRVLEQQKGGPLSQQEKDEVMAMEIPDKLLADYINRVVAR